MHRVYSPQSKKLILIICVLIIFFIICYNDSLSPLEVRFRTNILSVHQSTWNNLNKAAENLNETSHEPEKIVNATNIESNDESPNFMLKFHDVTIPLEWKYLPKIDCTHRRGIAIILSSPEARASREAIRNTWASANYSNAVKQRTVITLFIVGWTEKNITMQQLFREAEELNDVIIISQMDTYRNLVIKTFAAMKYHQAFCNNTDYLFKIDQDVIFFLDHFFALEARGKFRPTTPASYGNIWKKSIVQRDPKNRWYTSVEQYDKKYYPTFTSGPAYVLTRTAIPKLLAAAPNHNLVMVEDVFITGILATDAAVARINYPSSFYKYPQLNKPRKFCSREGSNQLISIHSFPFHRLVPTFHYLKNLDCPKLLRQR